MAKDKDRALNPAAAQRKQEKQKSVKKGKAEAQARRNEKLARRNPDRIQRQINDLKSAEENGQRLRPRDKEVLEALERDLKAVLKAREALGEKAPKFAQHHHQNQDGYGRGGDGGVLGKRRRGSETGRFQPESESSETDEDVRRIPMPRDTPPPIPRSSRQGRGRGADAGADTEMNRNGPHPLPSRPTAVEHKTVYEAKPEIRNLRQEATNRFVPAAVRRKQDSVRGTGKLLEPEEMDKLEMAGYTAGPGQPTMSQQGQEQQQQPAEIISEEEQRRMEEEERRFNRELKTVQIEEVEDEDA